ncbi:MAG: T9SS type A sorting domain-containing protein [Calditrichaeota bacterium]|nr:T9SS type A sorting domain-containing protein [Calditrichota bacterium]MCB9367054.1 T9SS type A sorting domain-containing protein [Calditrichota bacterium]MCB9391462.1 T9SS type A sorting domain-containing protein [Calditrichota bacterium]
MNSTKKLFMLAMLLVFGATTAQAAIGWAGQIWPTTGQTRLPSENIGVYLQIWKGGCTDVAGPCADIEAWLAYKTASAADYDSVLMTFNVDIGSNDEWTANIPASATVGGEDTYFYCSIRDISDDSWYFGAMDQAGNSPPFTLHIQEGLSFDTPVTFSVDMNCVNPDLFASGVFFTGDFLGWSPCNPNGGMSDVDNDGIWEGTFVFPAGSNPSIQYKFTRNDGVNCGWECGGNRLATIEDNGLAQTLDLQVFCCETWGPESISGPGSYCVSLCCCDQELWVRLNSPYNPPYFTDFSYVPGCVDCDNPDCTPGSGDIIYEIRQGGDMNWYLVLCLLPEAGRELPPGEDVYAGCFCITIDNILPVEMASFDAVGMEDAVQVNWTTATEHNTSHFILDRSTNLNTWTTVAQLNARGESTSASNYSFTDANVEAGTSYSYRLTVVDMDGSSTVHAQIASATPQGAATVTEFALAQNYPNPFNPETNISYTLADAATVTLKVFTVTGEEVATLVSGAQIAGSHTVAFSAAALPSGVYFYRLDAGNFTATRKMLLLK